MKFDKNKYDIEYKKQNYKRFVMELKPEFNTLIQDYSNDIQTNKTAFVKACILYCIDNNIDLSKYIEK